MPLRKDGSYRKPRESKPVSSAPKPPSPPAAEFSVNRVKETLLPFLSPDDMKTVGQEISSEPEFSQYKDMQYPSSPSRVTPEVRDQYLSSTRAESALAALENMRAATGKSAEQLGPGYAYLISVVNTLKNIGSSSSGTMNRAQFIEFKNAINSLYEQNRDNYDVNPFTEIARKFAFPSFSGGGLQSFQEIGDRIIFGKRNKRLF
jgi:hypothetical protein